MSFHFRRDGASAVALSLCITAHAADSQDAAPRAVPQEVVITAVPLRESGVDTTQPASVVDEEALLRLRGVSLGETLASQPGVSATWFGPQASRPVIRGLSGERVQMYEDGGEALDVSALSSDHATSIDPLVAERVEIVRGPATLLFGNGASGGVVNVVTNRIPRELPERDFSGAAELRGDYALGERSAGAHFDAAAGDWVVHVDGHRRRTDDLRIPGIAWSRALRDATVAAGGVADETSGELLNSRSDSRGGSLGLSHVAAEGFAGVNLSRFESVYGIPGEEIGARIDMAQTRADFRSEWRDPLPALSNARLQASWNDYTHAEIEPTGDVGTRFDQRGLEVRTTFDHAPVAGLRGTFGAQFRDIDFVASGDEAFVPASRTRNVGVFWFEERPLGAVTIELGARYESQRISPDAARGLPQYDRDNANVAAGALWKFAPGLALALNLTSTERHPSATELYADGPHFASRRFEIGDAALTRERAHTVDLGLRRTAGDWRFSVAAYLSDYAGYIYPRSTGAVADDLPVVQYVQADARFRGVEAEVELPVLRTVRGDFAARLTADSVRARLAQGGNLPQIPPLRVGAALDWSLARWTAGVALSRYDRQNRTDTNELATAGYTMLDFDVNYSLPIAERTLQFFLRGTNLLDEEARRHTSPLKDIAPLPARSIAAGVRFDF